MKINFRSNEKIIQGAWKSRLNFEGTREPGLLSMQRLNVFTDFADFWTTNGILSCLLIITHVQNPE